MSFSATIFSSGRSRWLIVLWLLSCTSACQLLPSFTPEKVIVDDLNLQDITNQNKAITSAIEKLENGNKVEASELINSVLRANAKHQKAMLLNKQLTETAAKLFSTTRTTKYKVKAGDTLGSIAATWLEDSIYFVSLAKLNMVENPSKIQPDTVLIIPVIATSPLVKQELRRSSANLELIGRYNTEKEYLKSLTRMTNIFVISDHHKLLKQAQLVALKQLSTSRVSISEKHRMIDQIKVISANSKRNFLEPNFQRFIKSQLHNVLLQEFLLLFEDNSYQQAAGKVIEAKNLKIIAQENFVVLDTEQQLINKLHEKAIILRKNQQLEKAMVSWQLILELQPDNTLAMRYLDRTKKLLARLEKLQ